MRAGCLHGEPVRAWSSPGQAPLPVEGSRGWIRAPPSPPPLPPEAPPLTSSASRPPTAQPPTSCPCPAPCLEPAPSWALCHPPTPTRPPGSTQARVSPSLPASASSAPIVTHLLSASHLPSVMSVMLPPYTPTPDPEASVDEAPEGWGMDGWMDEGAQARPPVPHPPHTYGETACSL